MPGLEPSYENIIKQELQIADLKRAIAEKDLEWKRRVGLDCGGHSCYFAIEKKGMRHNGPCTCNPKRTKEDHDRLYKSYHALMKQAVEFAENTIYIMGALCSNRHELESNSHVLRARAFLASPEVQAWRERKDEKTRLQNNIHRSPSHLEAVPIPEPEEEP